LSAWESSCYAATRVREHYVLRSRIRNWREYNRALVNRGRLTVWFDEEAIAARRKTEPGPGPGAPRRYSDLALECALVLKAVFHLSLRATQGFLASARELMALTLPIPDYSTIACDYTIKFFTLGIRV